MTAKSTIVEALEAARLLADGPGGLYPGCPTLEMALDLRVKAEAALATLEGAEVWWQHPQARMFLATSAGMAKALAGDNGEPHRVITLRADPEPGE